MKTKRKTFGFDWQEGRQVGDMYFEEVAKPITTTKPGGVLIIEDDSKCVAIMQATTGTLSPGAHPGSYNGQDAYNDMLVTDERKSNRQRTTSSNTDDNNIERSGLYARSTGDFNRGGA